MHGVPTTERWGAVTAPPRRKTPGPQVFSAASRAPRARKACVAARTTTWCKCANAPCPRSPRSPNCPEVPEKQEKRKLGISLKDCNNSATQGTLLQNRADCGQMVFEPWEAGQSQGGPGPGAPLTLTGLREGGAGVSCRMTAWCAQMHGGAFPAAPRSTGASHGRRLRARGNQFPAARRSVGASDAPSATPTYLHHPSEFGIKQSYFTGIG